MGDFVYKPERLNLDAAGMWAAGQRNEAVMRCLEALDADPAPHRDAFVQPGAYLFQLHRFDVGTKVLERGLELYPDEPMILLTLGSSYSRWYKPDLAIPLLERFLALGLVHTVAFDSLALSCATKGDFARSRRFGTMALDHKDRATSSRHGTPSLEAVPQDEGKLDIIAFTLFGSRPRYLRGAMQNVIASRDLYPGWTCRFYVDPSVDETFRQVIEDEGAELVMDDSGNEDPRQRLSRRFLVSDDPGAGRFLVRDCDSVVSEREAAAVAEWIASGLPFHVMRDWYTHTDPMLAGMWGGTAGMFPDISGTIARFRETELLTTIWDQYFLQSQVWPAIRDHCMVHDRCFESYRAQPFPTATPVGEEHVGQNEYATGKEEQEVALAAFAERVPALALPRPVKLDFKLG